MAEELRLDIKPELEDFNNHIKINKNIILSAPFGDGKSYMLQQFKEKYANHYHFITLYPVNYTIADNGDILEYIKRDIIFQLLRDGLISDTTDFSTVCGSLFTAENINEFIDDISNSKDNSSLLGAALKVLIKAKEKYDSEKKTASKLLYHHQKHKGGLYEDDLYTMIIKAGLKNPNKTTVLIVEDLDRVDPAHLFRLLNVFSTQFDRPYINDDDYKSSNKFGFNKTILVMDYEQTELLYEHFYGNKAGYHGYMSKLMTTQPYRFDIKQKAQDFLYHHIVKDVGVSEVGFECFTQIKKKIKALSVREVVAVLSADISSFIKVHSLNMYNGEPYSTVGGATKCLFYMQLLGCSMEDFKMDFLSQQQDRTTLLKLLAPFILEHAREREFEVRYSNGELNSSNSYTILLKDDGEISVSKTFKVSEGRPNDQPTLEKAIQQMIDCTYCKGMK